ncbi:MAG: DNA repair exonuclease [Candidatus Thermoplasmatota archaeon]|jgi:DNA repair exonuclease SbcCD nuclease subunit|nr:DNA repair exonuclease [Candidatus Thermoplasmatota archaeon]MCL5987896.1 DNA repair exonuclease [Candidatus Thermoplasmatota archaeon]
MTRFAHISDTHIGAVQYGIPERETDFYDAFSEAIDVAMENEVDFIIHTGDLFDTGKPSNSALSCLKNNMIKLQEKKIPMIAIPGDHDRPRGNDSSPHSIFDFMGMKIIGAVELDNISVGDVTIAGIGNMKGFRKEQLNDIYEKANRMAEEWKECIFMSHQAVAPFFPEDQCETSKDKLPVNFDYLAFGHIHQYRKETVGRSIFSYAGSTEVKSMNEISGLMKQGKGINIVTLGDSAEIDRKQIRSARMQYEVRGSIDEIFSQLDGIKKNEIKKPLISITVTEKVEAHTLKEKIDEYSDRFMFRNPIFNFSGEETPFVEFNPEHDMQAIFREYMKDEKKGMIAHHIYKLLTSGEFRENEIIELASGGSDDN